MEKENHNTEQEFCEIENDDLRSQEARELLNLNEEISSIIGTSDRNTEELMENISQRPQRIITNRGYEVFDYDELKREYDNSTPILRDFNLPLAKPIMKSHVKFWMVFSPFLGGTFYTAYHLSM